MLLFLLTLSSSSSSRSAIALPFFSPTAACQIVPGQFVEHGAARVAHGIVYEADVRTPAGTSLVNRAKLALPLFSLPELAEIEVEVRERRKLFAQLAGAHVAVVINHDGRFARRAWKRPGRL